MKRFASRTDPWLFVLLVLAIAGQLIALILVVVRGQSPEATVIVALTVILGISLIVSVLIHTHYTVADDRLTVVSGPFRWTIPLADITSVTASHNPLSSPALSLDRLKIRYGKRKFILVSPEDKRGFLRAIGRDTN